MTNTCVFQPNLSCIFCVRPLVRSNHRSDTILLSNESRISRPCLEIFSRNRKVILSEKDLCVCYTAKKVAYRSFPQWEILAFVAFCLEEFASALQEKYSREAWNRTGTESSQFSMKVGSIVPISCCIAILSLRGITKMLHLCNYYST